MKHFKTFHTRCLFLRYGNPERHVRKASHRSSKQQ